MLYVGSFCKEEQDGDEQVSWLVSHGREKEAAWKMGEAEEAARFALERQERDGWGELVGVMGGVARLNSLRLTDSQQDARAQCWDERLSISGLHSVGDAATAISVHSRFLVVGTQRGRVLISDLSGNTLRTYDDAHTAAVTDVSCSVSGDPIATCSRDGTVAVLSIYHAKLKILYTYPHPLRTISVFPDKTVNADAHLSAASGPASYRVRSGKYRFVTGGKAETLHLMEPVTGLSGVVARGAFSFRRKHPGGKEKAAAAAAAAAATSGDAGAGTDVADGGELHRETPIASGGGAVHVARWEGDLIAYCTDDAVAVYDVSARCGVPMPDVHLPRRGDHDFRSTVCWETQEVLLVGWGSTLLTFCIMPCPTREERGRATRYEIQPLSRFEFGDSLVCGIAPFNTKVVVLTIGGGGTSNAGNNGENTPPSRARLQPELRVVGRDAKGDAAEEVAYRMQLQGVETMFAMHYHLAHEEYVRRDAGTRVGDLAYMVMTPNEVVSVQPRDAAGHLLFLAGTGRLSEARHHLGRQEWAGRLVVEENERELRTLHVNTLRATTSEQLQDELEAAAAALAEQEGAGRMAVEAEEEAACPSLTAAVADGGASGDDAGAPPAEGGGEEGEQVVENEGAGEDGAAPKERGEEGASALPSGPEEGEEGTQGAVAEVEVEVGAEEDATEEQVKERGVEGRGEGEETDKEDTAEAAERHGGVDHLAEEQQQQEALSS